MVHADFQIKARCYKPSERANTQRSQSNAAERQESEQAYLNPSWIVLEKAVYSTDRRWQS